MGEEITNISDENLEKLADIILNKSGDKKSCSIVKVGNDRPTDAEMVERQKRAIGDLRSQNQKHVEQIARLQLDISELERLNTNKKIRAELRKKIDQLQTANVLVQERDKENNKLVKQQLEELAKKEAIQKELTEIKSERDELTEKVKELKEEIQARIDEDSRFNMLDL